MTNEWLKEITVNDLPESYREMSEKIGIENTIKLALHYGGLPYYFLKIDSLLRDIRDEKIKKEFTGSNYDDLARKYKLSQMQIRRIVHGVKDDRQVDMFGEPDEGSN